MTYTETQTLLSLALLILVYLFPFFIAAGRKHHQTGAIFILNLFLGWTLLGSLSVDQLIPFDSTFTLIKENEWRPKLRVRQPIRFSPDHSNHRSSECLASTEVRRSFHGLKCA